MSQNIHDFEFNPSTTKVLIWRELVTDFQRKAIQCIANHLSIETHVMERQRYIYVSSKARQEPSHDT
jgi:hypothetical protein